MRSHLSYSAFSDYTDCPPCYKAAYIDGDPGVTPPALKNGSDIHNFAERYGRHCFTQQRTSDLQFGRQLALGYMEPVRSLAEKWVEDWRWEWGSTIVEGVAPFEQEFLAKLPDGERVFSSHVDLVQRYEGAGGFEFHGATADGNEFSDDDDTTGIGDGALWIVTDFKSGFYGDCRDPENMPRQGKWYCWNVQQNYPQARVMEYRLYSFRTGATLSWLTGGDLSYIGYELQAIADRIATETQWEPTPGEACLACLHIATCPLRETPTVRVVVDTSTDEWAGDWYWHKAQYQEANKYLKAHDKLTPGAVVGFGWGEKKVLRPVMDRGALAEECTKRGHDITELLGDYSKTKVEKSIEAGWQERGEWNEVVTGREFGPLKRNGNDDAQGERDGNGNE